MNMFLIIAFLFFIGSFGGWFLEVVYRKWFEPTNTTHKWINPGFLTGPYLPLYGVSLSILYLLSKIEVYINVNNEFLKKFILFCVMAVCITIVEYFTGLIFIVKLKIKLWDYTDNKWNIKGIICPLFTFYWLILSAVYYFVINPYVLKSLTWLSENLAFSFGVGFFYGIFCIDLFVSLRNLLKIHKFAAEEKIVVFIDELKRQIVMFKEQKDEKGFFLSFNSFDTIQNHLIRYKEKLTSKELYKFRFKIKNKALNQEKNGMKDENAESCSSAVLNSPKEKRKKIIKKKNRKHKKHK